MALSVPCEFCGPRGVEEFMYGDIPQVPADLTDPDRADLDRVFMRSNPEGAADEGWFHVYGCRRWTYLRRHRTSDQWLPIDL